MSGVAPQRMLKKSQQFLADIQRNRIRLNNVQRLHVQTFRRSQINQSLKNFLRWQVPTLRFHNPEVQITNANEREAEGQSHLEIEFSDGSTHKILAEQGLVDHHILNELVEMDQKFGSSSAEKE